ncbi:hypothetical protein [Pedobacter nyackensis]|uniref:BNR repeat-like domain-containing protein n=1 Tax=Pedobacter nyackensis TaxID=475255 RepID=A0A1W2ES55_9SPHI|nr:hypothetical protein [Pedobacter nyackensis]SMD12412.1 hypothetical protein SAMN04488101_11532 [Pedobacter nyackensis]
MKKISFPLLVVTLLLAACNGKPGVNESKALNTSGLEAVGPYFTSDHKGNAVLCWTEQDVQDSLYRLKYAVYDQQKDQFGRSVTVPGSAGCSVSAESMAKIVFKSDGTVMAVFAKRFPNEKSPYAGAIYYSMSADGKNWSDPDFLHSDTSHAYGRSFFDLTRLKDGELAAVWLDGRFGKSIKGSALFFNRTEKGKGFAAETCLDKGTCECCRTDFMTDEQGNLHMAYRSIMFPTALSDKQVRDMVYKKSTDNGQTFSEAKTISNDNWEINGCPHSGPSLAVTDHTLHAVWFTAGGSSGLYETSATESGFRPRQLITASGKHPQLVALANGKIAMVCEESADHGHDHMNMDHSKAGMTMSHSAPAGMSKIVLRISGNGEPENKIELTKGLEADNHAVLTPVNGGLLVAWVREGEKGASIHYTYLKQ